MPLRSIYGLCTQRMAPTGNRTRQIRLSFRSRTTVGFRPRIEQLEPRVVLNGGPIINEALAINNRTIQDYDDDWTDWFEVTNTSTEQIDLDGYYLTDDRTDLRKWQVPTPTPLDPSEHLVFFASGKDFVAPTGEFHVNFNLNSNGDYLALIEPDGQTITWQYDAPLPGGEVGFPQQLEDISYGVATTTVQLPLVAPDADIEYLVPVSAEQLSADWTEAGFTDPDGVWTASPSGNGVGFQTDGDEFTEFIQTDLTGVMHGENASAFVRAEFAVPSGVTLEDLTLGVRYNDGFVAYLNGTEIARRNAPTDPVWNSTATAERDSTAAVQLEEIPLTVGRLLSDFHTIKDNTFLVDLPSGEYDVTIHQGDLARLRDEMAIFLEDTQVDTVTTQEGEIVTHTYRVEVTDGQLSLRLEDQGGATGRSAINALVITPADAMDLSSTRTIDFGRQTSPVEPGAIQVHAGHVYSQAAGYGWSNDDIIGVERPPDASNLQLLQAGPNVLALQGMNIEATDADFLLQFELIGNVLEVDTTRIGYFMEPTPGEANHSLFAPEVAALPGFSVAGAPFADDFTLELTTDVPSGRVHYTLDQTVPTPRSTVFDPASPISVTTTTQVRAIVVAPGHLPSPVVSQTYMKLANDVLDFRSQLPLLVVDNFGEGQFDLINNKDVYWAIFEPDDADGFSSLVSAPDLQTRAGIRVRGSSSANSLKKQFSMEAWDEKDQDKNVSPLGMPAESDWVLSSLTERTMMRNSFAFELSNQMGRYGVRTRYVEVFVEIDGDELSEDDYVGVYALVEKISRDNDRVDVKKLSKNYDTEPLITGGYMFKFDKLSPGDGGFSIRGIDHDGTTKTISLEMVDPKEVEIEEPGRQPQKEFLEKYLTDMSSSLTNPDPLTGYPSFINVDAWVDVHWLHVFLTDSDGFRNSHYFYKPRNGQIAAGPLWDMDRTMGWDGCTPFSGQTVCSPTVWANQGFKTGTFWFTTPLADHDYRQKFIDRYQELREDLFRIENLSAIVSSMAAQITVDAAVRNNDHWGNPPSWLGEVEQVQQWLEDRVNWIDDQLIPKPILTPSEGVHLGGPIELGGPLPPGSLGFDFGRTDSPVSDGYTGVSDQPFDNQTGYGWTSGNAFDLVDRGGSDDLGRDFVAVGDPAIFSVDLENDTYDITVLMGDTDTVRDQMQLRLEPGEQTEVRDAVTVTPQWMHKKTYTVEIEDGQLNLELSDLAGGISTQAVINALVITPSDIDTGLVPSGTTFTLSMPEGAPEGTKIFYTLDGTDPRISIIDGGTAEIDGDRTSPLAMEYTDEVITIDGATTIRARAFLPESTKKFVADVQTIDWSGVARVSVNVEAPQLAITEINYNPASPTGDELAVDPNFDNDHFEFIEIQNVGTGPAELTGYSFTDGVEYTFSSLTLEPQGYAIVVRNQDAFQARYGTEHNVVGEYSGGLANRGDQLELSDTGDNVVFRLVYDDRDPWPERADGAGSTLELVDPAGTPADEFGKYYRWRGSTLPGGSPSAAGEDAPGVLINEVFTRPDPAGDELDAVELFNPTDQPIDMGGWYLSDSQENLLKYQIPAGTIIPAGGYVVFDESHFNPTPNNPAENHFGLSGTQGDDVWLVTGDGAGQMTRFVDDVHFGASAIDESLGRVPNSTGRLVPNKSVSLEDTNDSHRASQIVISEVQYHPGLPTAEALALYADLDENDLEYVEIHNPTAERVDLGGWQLSGGIEIEFQQGTMMDAGEALVIVSFNPDREDNVNRVAAFRRHYGLDENVRLLGGYAGSLSNSGELLQLRRPGTPSDTNPARAPMVWEDETLYDDRAPWPTEADGLGKSLVRSSVDSLGNMAESWTAADPSPAVHELAFAGDMDLDGDIDFDDIDDFLLAMNDPAAYETKFGVSAVVTGDFNGDSNIDGDDINEFVHRLMGGKP